METIVVIEEKEIKLVTHGATPILFKKHFGVDMFTELSKLSKDNIEVEIFNKFLWLAAKTANKELVDYETWTASFESYPVLDCLNEVQEMLMKMMSSGKKLMPVNVAVQKAGR